MRRALPVAVCVTALVAVTGCGSDPDPGSAGATGGRGPITIVDTKSHEQATRKVIDAWNAQHPDERVTLDIQPRDADSQRQRLVNNAQTRSDAIDVLLLDIVWVAEFAANRWIDPLPESLAVDGLLPTTVETAKYRGRLYAMPWLTGSGLLYYRTDLVSKAPTTWAQMKQSCDAVLPKRPGMSCYAATLDKYEGLTVNFSEAVQSAGGQVADASGTPAVGGDAAQAGLRFLADGLRSGMIPRDAITYKEDEVRAAFESGKVVFARNWASMYGTANADGSGVAGKVGVAPIPGLNGPGSSTLGGANLAISAFSKHKETARDFIAFLTSAEQMKTWAMVNSTPVAPADLYDDPELVARYPYLPALKQGILAAKPRVMAVRYGDVTAAIQNAVYPALRGEREPAQAMSALQTELTELLKQ